MALIPESSVWNGDPDVPNNSLFVNPLGGLQELKDRDGVVSSVSLTP